MPAPIDPPRSPMPAVALALAEAALQRQTQLLGGAQASGAQAHPASGPATPGDAAPGLPTSPPPSSLQSSSPQPSLPPGTSAAAGGAALHLSDRARSQLAAERAALPSGPTQGHPPGRSAPAQGSAPGHALPAALASPAAGPSSPVGAAPAQALWPTSGASAPQRPLLAALVQQLTAPVQEVRVRAAQPWPAALVQVAEGAADDSAGAGLPPLQTWLVRQGLLQTASGERAFTATLRVPVPWLQALPAQAGASSGVVPTAPWVLAFAGKAQALPTGTWALVLQPLQAPAPRTSALLHIELQPPPAPPTLVYGRDPLLARQDPWLHMAQQQATYPAAQDPATAHEREAALCHTPGCPYAGRAACEQPFCLALRSVVPVGAVVKQGQASGEQRAH